MPANMNNFMSSNKYDLRPPVKRNYNDYTKTNTYNYQA